MIKMAAEQTLSPYDRFSERLESYRVIERNPDLLNNLVFEKRAVYDPFWSRLEDAIIAHRAKHVWANYRELSRVSLDIAIVTNASFRDDPQVLNDNRVINYIRFMVDKYEMQLYYKFQEDEGMRSTRLFFMKENERYIRRNITGVMEDEDEIDRLMYVYFVELQNRIRTPLPELDDSTPDLVLKRKIYSNFYRLVSKEKLYELFNQSQTWNTWRYREADMYFQLGLITFEEYQDMFGAVRSLKVRLFINPDINILSAMGLILAGSLGPSVRASLKLLYNQIYKLFIKTKTPIDPYFLDAEETLLRESGSLSVSSYVGITPEYIPREASLYNKAISSLNETGEYSDEMNGNYYMVIEGGIERTEQDGFTVKVKSNNPKLIDDFLRHEYPTS